MDEIKGIARVKFHPGKVEEWKRLSEEAMEIVRTRDSGTLQYEIFFNEDESEAVVFERYRDADADRALFQHQPFDGADHGHRLRHGRSAGNAEREDERAARKGRPEAIHAVDRVAGSRIGGGGITATRSPERRFHPFELELTYRAFDLAHVDTVRKAGVSINPDRLAGQGPRGRAVWDYPAGDLLTARGIGKK